MQLKAEPLRRTRIGIDNALASTRTQAQIGEEVRQCRRAVADDEQSGADSELIALHQMPQQESRQRQPFEGRFGTQDTLRDVRCRTASRRAAGRGCGVKARGLRCL